MGNFNKNDWMRKTGEYMDYITQHKKNVCLAWEELRNTISDVDFLMRPNILSSMEYRVRTHDDSKMSEEEFLAYRQHFYPVEGENAKEQDYQKAWETHYHRNDHHWEYWISEDGGFIQSYSVDEKICAYLEMICDWQAMGYVFGDSAPNYYSAHKSEIHIDSNWVGFVEEILQLLTHHLVAERK